MMETPAWWESYRTGSADSIRVGEGTQIAPGARLDGASGPIELGRNCQIHDGALLLPYGGSITVGDDCTVNPYTVIYGHGGVQIGNGVRIATHVVIVPANHVFSDLDRPIFQQGLTMEGITIEDDVWIGCNVTILDGARIGTGCVVAAGSVVRGRHAPMSVIGGTPARLLRNGTNAITCLIRCRPTPIWTRRNDKPTPTALKQFISHTRQLETAKSSSRNNLCVVSSSFSRLAGVCRFRVVRGRRSSIATIQLMSSGVWVERCGECGSQKYSVVSSAVWIFAWSASLVPRSQVIERRR